MWSKYREEEGIKKIQEGKSARRNLYDDNLRKSREYSLQNKVRDNAQR